MLGGMSAASTIAGPVPEPLPPPRWTERARALPWIAAAALLALTAVMSFAGEDPGGPIPRKVRGMDLVQFWAGGAVLAAGDAEHLYVRKRSEAELKAIYPPKTPGYMMGYPPPIYQLAALPQSTITYPTAAKLTLFAATLLHLLASAFLLRNVPTLRPWLPWALALAFVLPGAIQTTIAGQLGGLWLALLVVAWRLRAAGKPVLAGACLGAFLVKPTLLAPIGLAFVVLGEAPVLVGVALGGAAVAASSFVAPGGAVAWDAWLHRASDPSAMLAQFWHFSSRQINLRSLLGDQFAEKGTANLLGWAGMALGGALTLATAWPRWRDRAALAAAPADPDRANLQLGAVLSAAFLTGPHFLEYDFALHLIGLAAAAAWIAGGRARWPRAGAALLAGAWLSVALIKLNKLIHFNVTTVLVTAWVVWMGAELWATRGGGATRRRGARTAHTSCQCLPPCGR